MRIHMTIGTRMTTGIIGAILGILGITLTMLVPLNSFGQKPTVQSEPVVKILAGETVPQPKVRLSQSKPPAPLSLAEKQRILKSVLTSLREQNKANPQLNVRRIFPIGPNSIESTAQALSNSVPVVLSPQRPWIDNVAWLEFLGSTVSSGGLFVNAFWPGGGEVQVNVKANVGGQMFVLDFVTANATSAFIGVGKSGGVMSHMQMDVTTGGHILVPLVAAQDTWYLVTVKSQQQFFTFYSVEVHTLK